MDGLIELGIFLVLIAVGLVFGRAAEQRHFRELTEREAQLRTVLVFAEKSLPVDREIKKTALVVGSVVIAEDNFKRISASLRSLFGGRVTVYESLMDRGRREAVLRMKEQARRLGATMVLNVRFETSSLSEDTSGESPPRFSAEFIAYGTALVP